ncbi:Vps62-related protein [Pseudoalteromonas sp. OOF1S-7]|uniref:Vps62-related protein n=1 Tax=Pseudoalteromonas sp. OOF1S-7 TaxID=2917757 RepID=UPI001EF745B7|nr:Vps62-related protein [Pseudoalteromonas sp. OOF1S-7]MCG7535472.1 Vps62-related protein [Pseudoalteromonas sp. OOF1S-7]
MKINLSTMGTAALVCLLPTFAVLANDFTIRHADINGTLGTVSFGQVPVGGSKDIAIDFYNGEQVDVLDNCATYPSSNSNFQIVSQTCGDWTGSRIPDPYSVHLAPNSGSSCRVTMRYTPSGVGADNDRFQLYCNDSSYNGNSRPTFYVNLSGNTSPTLSTPGENLIVKVTNSYSLVWKDAGSGANLDGSFWKPIPENGFHIVGHTLWQAHTQPDRGTITVKEKVPGSGALTPALSYELVWNDKGSGAVNDVSVWRPICQEGYSAIGDVASQGYTTPAPGEVQCILNSELIDAEFTHMRWNDQGSGAYSDFSGWEFIGTSPSTSYHSRTRGLFIGSNNYNNPAFAKAILTETPDFIHRAVNWTYSGGRDYNHPNNPSFAFFVEEATNVIIDLTSSVDTYLYLLNENGAVIALNDDGGEGYNSRIQQLLDVGHYRIVTATYSTGRSGSGLLKIDSDKDVISLGFKEETANQALNEIADWFPEDASTIATHREHLVNHLVNNTPLPTSSSLYHQTVVMDPEIFNQPEFAAWQFTECDELGAIVGFDAMMFTIGAVGLHVSNSERVTRAFLREIGPDTLRGLSRQIHNFNAAVGRFDRARSLFGLVGSIYNAGGFKAIFKVIRSEMSWWDWIKTGIVSIAQLIAWFATDGVAFVAEVALTIMSGEQLLEDSAKYGKKCLL